MATAIGGNTRIISGKDMEHLSMLMETDTWGNTCRVANTGMEYTEIQMEMHIMDSRNKKRKMVTDISGGLVATNTMDSTKMI